MILAYATIMLNTDLHNVNVPHIMTKPQFVKNNKGIDRACYGEEGALPGRDIPQAVLVSGPEALQ
jgi:Sec7-like guanine-nucleotide exchange factor